MATIPPDTEVALSPGEAAKLTFPPPHGARLYVAVHRAALRVGEKNRLTQLVGLVDGDVRWVGAVDERMLIVAGGNTFRGARSHISRSFFEQDEPWDIIWPGLLTAPGVRRPYFTLYDGDRPWVSLGRLPAGTLAAPLNDAHGNPKWWAPRIDATDLEFLGGKAAQIELAHLWTVEAFQMRGGVVSSPARAEIEDRVRAYVS